MQGLMEKFIQGFPEKDRARIRYVAAIQEHNHKVKENLSRRDLSESIARAIGVAVFGDGDDRPTDVRIAAIADFSFRLALSLRPTQVAAGDKQEQAEAWRTEDADAELVAAGIDLSDDELLRLLKLRRAGA